MNEIIKSFDFETGAIENVTSEISKYGIKYAFYESFDGFFFGLYDLKEFCARDFSLLVSAMFFNPEVFFKFRKLDCGKIRCVMIGNSTVKDSLEWTDKKDIDDKWTVRTDEKFYLWGINSPNHNGYFENKVPHVFKYFEDSEQKEISVERARLSAVCYISNETDRCEYYRFTGLVPSQTNEYYKK